MKTLRYSTALAAAITLTSGMAQAEVTLNLLLDGNADTIAQMEALTAAYTAANPDVTFEVEKPPRRVRRRQHGQDAPCNG